ncbi:alanine--glyoxylate aminotransferase 2, mitochondrial [Prorops nasuta]|uniref:alanine--glyoxylate aminotransferase 2, mitochondrial n=1 Tax=Prorops nasuta TaxID=863751 RepID=UPI0034CF31C5
MLQRSLIWFKVRNFSTERPCLPPCKYKPLVYKGPSYNNIRSAFADRIFPSVKQYYKEPLLINEGKAQWLWDHTGKRYLDMFAGIVTVAVGHCHPKVVSAMTDQASRLGHISGLYMHPYLHEYVEKLTNKFPKELNVVYLCNSGSEANELAFLMSRIYTGENYIVSLRNAYHGGSYSSAAASGMTTWRYSIAQPTGHVHTMNPDVYRGPWGNSGCRDCPVKPAEKICSCSSMRCEASEKYFHQLEDVLRSTLPNSGKLAGFIAESIQGIGGVVQYPKGFLKKVRKLVRAKGGLFIADEVQTGFGRTGEHFWGFEGHDLTPDIVTLAKGIGNGFPLSAVVTTKEIADSLNKALHFNTFAGNAVACAVGSAVLDVIEEEGLQENSRVVGTYLLNRLFTLIEEFPYIVGDVRGKGLMIGVELIQNPKTKEHLSSEQMADIFEDIKDMGVLVGKGGLYGNVLRIKPPLCVTKEDSDYAFEVIKTALQRHKEKHMRAGEPVICNGI